MEENTVTKEEYDALQDKYVRLYADFDNYRKNKESEMSRMKVKAYEGMLEAILPTLDNLRRAIDQDSVDPIIKIIASDLTKSLNGIGISWYGEVGEDFNEDLHCAIFADKTTDMPKGKITQVITQGVKLNENIIRYAQVGVAG